MITRNCDICQRTMPRKLRHVEIRLDKMRFVIRPKNPAKDVCKHCIERMMQAGVSRQKLDATEIEDS